jgi:hypothetical protein
MDTLSGDSLENRMFSHLGANGNGSKKSMMCWNYVRDGKCRHINNIVSIRTTIKDRYHPEINELNYLKQYLK